MELELRFVTPVWTADATNDMRQVETTGLMGSLRWLYEVLIRGVGGWACDATGGERCKELDVKVYKVRLEAGIDEQQALAGAGLCPACRLFGATNWAKMFSLHIDDNQTEPARPFDLRNNAVTATQGSRYFFPRGRKGDITLAVHPRRPDDVETLRLVAGLFDFIRRNAALGAKTNLSYGVFRWGRPPQELPSPAEFAKMVALRTAVRFDTNCRHTGIWPNLQDMFLAEADIGRWNAEDFVNFKYDLREAFRDGPRIVAAIHDPGRRDNLRHFLLGSTDVNPSEASKIKMAVVDNRLRIWGWIPRTWNASKFGAVTQGKIRRILFETLQGKVRKFYRWRDHKQFKGNNSTELLRWMMEGKTNEP